MTNFFPASRYLRHMVVWAAIAFIAVGVVGAPARAEPNKQIVERAQQHKDEAIKLWERLVNIDSQTGDEEGLKAVGAIATEELKKLGAQIETVSAKPAVGDNIVASFSGTGKGKVFLIAHMDTVLPKGTAAARPFRIKDGRATGPGVSDNKGGIIAALYVLRILQDLEFQGLCPDHPAAEHQRGDRVARHPAVDREAGEGARRCAQPRIRPAR